VIENGKVVEQGNHASLISKGKGGAYFGLIKPQQPHEPITLVLLITNVASYKECRALSPHNQN